MPSSTYHTLNKAVENILKIQPKTILDIGVGFGKWGFLCREYLETWNNRVFPDQWTCKIDGVEIFEPYTKIPHVQSLYDEIFIGNAYEIIHTLPNYDLIIAMDIVEHLNKQDGIELCEDMLFLFTKACMINVPTGDWLNNVVIADNPAEEHQAIWEKEDLEELAKTTSTKVELIEWKQGNRTGCLGIFKK